MTGPLAVVGSGEYLPVMADVERALLDQAVANGRPRRYVQLPTAAALEGDERIDWWVALGVAQAERLEAEAVPVRVTDRDGADDPALAALVETAGLIYLSGGNPRHLADTLRGTAVWDAILRTWRDGAALAGCSAGAMVMAARVPDLRDPDSAGSPGLGLTPTMRVLPHFDRWLGRLPAGSLAATAATEPGVRLVGVDEDTALIHGLGTADGCWEVRGRQSVWLLDGEQRTESRSGSTLELDPPVDAW